MKTQSRSSLTTKEITVIAILAAAASVLFLLEFPILVSFYRLDFSNLPVLLGTFALGPLAGTMILGIKSLIGLLHSSSQGIGELADFLIGLAMVLPAGYLYLKKPNRYRALHGMILGTVFATAVAVLANLYLLIPFFTALYHMPIQAIVDMGAAAIPAVDSLEKFVLLITVPFNLLKWILISVLCFLIYKPLSPMLHGQVTKRQRSGKNNAQKK